MKALVLNGGRKAGDGTDAVEALLLRQLEEAGCEVEAVRLRNENIGTCKGCFGCWTNTPGVCRIDDAGRSVAAEVVSSDLAVLLSPLTFGGYSFELKKVVDRLIPLISPLFMRIDGETHHRPRYRSYPRLLGIGVAKRPDPDEVRVFKTLVERNALNFHAPAHGVEVLCLTEAEAKTNEKINAQLARLRRQS